MAATEKQPFRKCTCQCYKKESLYRGRATICGHERGDSEAPCEEIGQSSSLRRSCRSMVNDMQLHLGGIRVHDQVISQRLWSKGRELRRVYRCQYSPMAKARFYWRVQVNARERMRFFQHESAH